VIDELAAIPELAFSVDGAEALARAAVPTIGLRLAVERTAGAAVRSATVGVRLDIAPARRAYDAQTEARLVELFGAPERWGTTLRGIGWARTTVLVGPFDERTTVELAVPCSYDFEVAAAKYLHALRDGEIPLDLMFSGSVLYEVGGRIQAAPIPWDREATYRLPVRVWRAAIDTAFPDSAWLRLQREAFDRLYAYRARGAFTSWEDTIEALLVREGSWTR
jgi:Family of unknown function (DUF6084)